MKLGMFEAGVVVIFSFDTSPSSLDVLWDVKDGGGGGILGLETDPEAPVALDCCFFRSSASSLSFFSLFSCSTTFILRGGMVSSTKKGSSSVGSYYPTERFLGAKE